MNPPRASARTRKARARTVADRLADEYPGSAKELCALEFETPFQLLAATILSAQSTDVRVNMVTPVLFAAYPDAASLAGADPEAVEDIVRSTGFFRAKTKSLIGMAQAVVDRFGGEVPTGMEDLVTLPGVGRKTANVLRSVAFGLPGLPVDTHVGRLTRRLGLTTATDPVKVEAEVSPMVTPDELGASEPPTDPPRAGGVRGPTAALRGLRAERRLSVVRPLPKPTRRRVADGLSRDG